MAEVFFSYADADTVAARELQGGLQGRGYTCWMAPDNAVGSGPVDVQVAQAIDASTVMLVLVSRSARAAREVTAELQVAVATGKSVVAVWLEDVPGSAALEYLGRHGSRVDAFPGTIGSHLDRIAAAIAGARTAAARADSELLRRAREAAEQASAAARRSAGSSRPGLNPGAPAPDPNPAPGSQPPKESSGLGGFLGRILRRSAGSREPAPRASGLSVAVDDADDRGGDAAGDSVDCSVHCPEAVAPGTSFLVQAWLHLPEQSARANRLAVAFDRSARLRTFTTLQVRLAPGSRVDLDLRLPGLTIENPAQSMIWEGRPQAATFEVVVPATVVAPTSLIGTVGVAYQSVPIGHLKFQVTVDPTAAATWRRAGAEARRYRQAFVSYSSKDRDQVLPRVQMLKALGIDFFQDLLSLDPGEKWAPRIYQSIDACDLFLLFWSSRAKESEWVHREVKYALDRKAGDDRRPPEIRPIIIEGPPVPKPWDELADLQFNDQILYFMNR